ncbi:MAG: endonuclease/exonuclease/phosphatase family protein [Candidatus Binatia bacterium]
MSVRFPGPKSAGDCTAISKTNGSRLFSVASYNIHQCVGWDARRDPARVAEVIRNLDADIIGLQEVDSRAGAISGSYQTKYLAEVTGFDAIAGPTIQTHTGEYGNVLLTRRPIQDIRLLDLSVPGLERRGAIDAYIDIEGETVRVLVAHLGLRRTERHFQVTQLLTALSDRRTRIVILLCDLNEWFPLGCCLSWLDSRLGKSVPLRTFPSIFPFLALDRIWVCPNEALIDVSVHKTRPARTASDHFPLKGLIRR